MPRNALVDDAKKGEQWRVPVLAEGWPDKVRLSHLVAELLDRFRPDTQTKAEQFVDGALKVGLIVAIILDRFSDAYAALGALLGKNVPNGVCLRCGGPAVIEGVPIGAHAPNGGGR